MSDERTHRSEPTDDAPLEPWLAALAHEATEVDADAIPREMMWARLQQQRRTAGSTGGETPIRFAAQTTQNRRPTSQRWLWQAAGIAAVLVGGIGVGRYLLPATGPSQYQLAARNATLRADSVAALGLGPEALAALPVSNDPARVAMEEHLVRTVALLTTVRDGNPDLGTGAGINDSARDLLGTTRLLLDEPQLRDERTRRLLQDLELVLVQIVQARRSAPETKRAPGETMRETNLLPRVRAAVTATRRGDDAILGGGL